MTIYQDHTLLPESHRLALSSYIRDYKVVKVKDSYKVLYSKFYEDSWHGAITFPNKSDIVKYLRDKNRKKSIISVANGLIDRSTFMPANKALYLVISDRFETRKNIENMIKP